MELEAAWCVQLRQPAPDFWGSTPKRVTTFFKQHERNEVRHDHRAGIVASVIANANRNKNQRPYKPHDFFPSLKPKERNATLMKQQFVAVAKAARRKAGLE